MEQESYEDTKEQNMGKKSNHEIICEFLTGERNSYYRLAYSYVHNKEDALDIVQDAICKALSSSQRLDQADMVKPWFYRIIINTALDFLRRNQRISYMETDLLEDIGPFKADHYEDLDLKAALDRLPPANRMLILLRFYEDMKLEDIADLLDENVNTVKSRLYSTLRYLRLELE